MIKQIRYLGIAGFLVFASAGFAQYTLTLTTLGDGVSSGGVYVGPYTGTVSLNGNQIYSGFMICDDFSTQTPLSGSWYATETNAGSLNGTEKFGGASAQQDYDAIAWLANVLLHNDNSNGVPNVSNPNTQIAYSYAIWDIMDGSTAGGNSVENLINAAFAAVDRPNNPYVGSNVEVFTPSAQNPQGANAAQEFLVVNGPAISTPEPAAAAILCFDLFSLLAVVFLLRRYRVRA